MQFFRFSLPVFVVLGLVIGVPALASGNDNDNERAELEVFVKVNDSDYDPEDFTIEVDGEDASPDSFRGDEDGRTVHLDEGRYEVEVRNDRGLEVRYSQGCEGSIDEGEEKTCRITLDDDKKSYHAPYFNYPVQAPITITKGYIPAMPATGFPPIDAATVAFALAALAIIGYFTYPYARAAFTAVLR